MALDPPINRKSVIDRTIATNHSFVYTGYRNNSHGQCRNGRAVNNSSYYDNTITDCHRLFPITKTVNAFRST